MIIPRIKICCIGSIDEAKLAISFGAAAIGLVGAMPGGPGVISDELIFEIARTVPPPVATFLLTSEITSEGIIKHHQKTRTNTIQIVDELKTDSYQELREALPSIKIVQVIHMMDAHSVEKAVEISELVDAILLDSGNPTLPVKELGGTGRIHDWKLSRKIRESVTVPVFLAGGINAGNVKRAINEVQPFGIDLCSSVRTHGKLDALKLERFFSAVTS